MLISKFIKTITILIISLSLFIGCQPDHNMNIEPGQQIFPQPEVKKAFTSIQSFENSLIVGNEYGEVDFILHDGKKNKIARHFTTRKDNIVSEPNEYTVYYTIAKRSNSDTILWVGTRNNGLQKWKLDGQVKCLAIYKIPYKGTCYSPYHFVEDVDSEQLFVASSNGLYITSNSDTSLKLLYHYKHNFKKEPPEFRVFNIVRDSNRYYASSSKGLIIFNKTKARLATNNEVYWVSNNKNRLYAFCRQKPALTNPSVENILFIEESSQPQSVYLNEDQQWLIYPGKTIVSEKDIRSCYQNALTSFKQPVCKLNHRIYLINGTSIRQLFRYDSYYGGSTEKIISLLHDATDGTIYCLTDNMSMYEINQENEAKLIARINHKSLPEACYVYNHHFYLIEKDGIYSFPKRALSFYWVKPQKIITTSTDIKTSILYKNHLLVGTRTNLMSIDIEDWASAPDTILSGNYIEELRIQGADSILICAMFNNINSDSLYLYSDQTKQLLHTEKTTLSNLKKSTLRYINGYTFVLSDNRITIDGDTLVQSINIGPGSLSIYDSISKRFIVTASGNNGCYSINKSGEVQYVKFSNQYTFFKIVAGSSLILLFALLWLFRKAIQKIHLARQANSIKKDLENLLCFFEATEISNSIHQNIEKLQQNHTKKETISEAKNFYKFCEAQKTVIDYTRPLIKMHEETLSQYLNIDSFRVKNEVTENDPKRLKAYLDFIVQCISEEGQKHTVWSQLNDQLVMLEKIAFKESAEQQASIKYACEEMNVKKMRKCIYDNSKLIEKHEKLITSRRNLDEELTLIYGSEASQILQEIRKESDTIKGLEMKLIEAEKYVHSLKTQPLSKALCDAVFNNLYYKLEHIQLSDKTIIEDYFQDLTYKVTHKGTAYDFLKQARNADREIQISILMHSIIKETTNEKVNCQKIHSSIESITNCLTNDERGQFKSTREDSSRILTKNDGYRIFILLLSHGNYYQFSPEQLGLILGKSWVETRTAASRWSDAKKTALKIKCFESKVLNKRLHNLKKSIEKADKKTNI